MQMDPIQTEADFVIQFGSVISSSLSDNTQALQYNVVGIAEMELLDGSQTEADAESTNDAEVFGALGIIGRPLLPQTIDGQVFHLEVACVREDDGLIPIAARDLRLKMQGEGPSPGTLAFVGYGGGFHSLSAVDNGDGGTIHVLYCPYDFDSNGVAQKAHSIVMDPTPGNESIIIAHANGLAITMSDDDKKALLLKNASGDATFRLDDDGITMTAQTIVMSGGVIVGDPLTAVPLLAGPASPPSTKFYVSP